MTAERVLELSREACNSDGLLNAITEVRAAIHALGTPAATSGADTAEIQSLREPQESTGEDEFISALRAAGMRATDVEKLLPGSVTLREAWIVWTVGPGNGIPPLRRWGGIPRCLLSNLDSGKKATLRRVFCDLKSICSTLEAKVEEPVNWGDMSVTKASEAFDAAVQKLSWQSTTPQGRKRRPDLRWRTFVRHLPRPRTQ
jgi:hypothetical protein